MNTNINTGGQTPGTSSESTKAQQSLVSGILRPRWCVQRDDNTVVPLIAVDELPESVILKGIPIRVTLLEALKARMELTNGEHPAHGIRYQLDQPINTQTIASEEGDNSGSDDSRVSKGSESSTQKGSSASNEKGTKNTGGKDKRPV